MRDYRRLWIGLTNRPILLSANLVHSHRHADGTLWHAHEHEHPGPDHLLAHHEHSSDETGGY